MCDGENSTPVPSRKRLCFITAILLTYDNKNFCVCQLPKGNEFEYMHLAKLKMFELAGEHGGCTMPCHVATI